MLTDIVNARRDTQVMATCVKIRVTEIKYGMVKPALNTDLTKNVRSSFEYMKILSQSIIFKTFQMR